MRWGVRRSMKDETKAAEEILLTRTRDKRAESSSMLPRRAWHRAQRRLPKTRPSKLDHNLSWHIMWRRNIFSARLKFDNQDVVIPRKLKSSNSLPHSSREVRVYANSRKREGVVAIWAAKRGSEQLIFTLKIPTQCENEFRCCTNPYFPENAHICYTGTVGHGSVTSKQLDWI